MCLLLRLTKILFLFLLGCVYTPLFSTSIQLFNNSAYPLNAQIIDRAGRHLALIHLKAGQQYIFDASQGAFDKNIDNTYTPFTVIFLCDSGRPYDYSHQAKKTKKGEKVNKSEYINQFGVWTDVPRGATVTALECPSGSKSCVVRKNPKVKGKRSSNSRQTEGSNAWSNDGGISWTNDAGSQQGCTQWGECGQKDHDEKESAYDDSSPMNKGEKQFTNDEGETWTNDKGVKIPPPKSPNSKNKFKPLSKSKSSKKNAPSKEDGAWSNDGEQSWTNDKDSKKSAATPLPFKENS